MRYAAVPVQNYVLSDMGGPGFMDAPGFRICHRAADQRSALPVERRSDSDTTASDRPSNHLPATPRAGRLMPRISAFYGIVVTMYGSDHAPPHFHARYGEHEAQIAIDTGAPLAGELPIRVLRLIRGWVELHRVELRDDWERAQAREPLARSAGQ